MGKHKLSWLKIRKVFKDIHLWLGLTGGIVVFIVCLSGTIYVYNTEMTEWASPELYKVKETGNNQLPVENLITSLENESGGKVVGLSIPADPSNTYKLSVKNEKDKSKSGTWFVNPYNGEIQGNGNDEGSMKSFLGSMFSLHRWLLLDKIEKPIINGVDNLQLGRYITGTATILFVIGCITGMIIWFPNRIRNWRQGLKIKTSGNLKRINHDLHNTLAFYSLIFLLVMGLTGLQWSFSWYRTGLQKTLGVYKEPPAKNISPGKPAQQLKEKDSNELNGEQISLSRAILIANNELNYKGDLRITLPSSEKAEYSFSKTKTGFFAPAAGDRLVINANAGEVKSKDIFRKKPFNERIAANIKALHVGNVFGGFTKLLYFITCLIATSLPVTGTIIWLNKLKKRKRRASKTPAFYPGKPATI